MLAEIEKTLQLKSIGNYFDLIAGTSVGGIIALALGLGLSAQEMQDFFVTKGPEIFPATFFPGSTFRLLFGRPRYGSKALENALKDAFGTKTLADSRTRLVVPAFDATCADIHVYKTPHHPRLTVDHRLSAVEVAMATAAAPTYFPAYDSQHCITLVDGGIWANDPTAIAVIEAISVLGWDSREIQVLSIGCTEEAIDFRQTGHGGVFWLRRAIEAAMRGQSRASQGMARHLTGRDLGMENIIRINPKVSERRFALDRVSGIQELRGFGYSQARHAIPELMNRFFQEEAEPFVGQLIPGGPTASR
jgi:uncharacterized protein